MRIFVDLDLCEANGICMKACPEVFELTDEDELVVHESKITEALRSLVDSAVSYCPRGALRSEG